MGNHGSHGAPMMENIRDREDNTHILFYKKPFYKKARLKKSEK